MRIAIVVDSLHRGGSERQACCTARGLAMAGHEVELFYYHRSEFEYDETSVAPAKLTYLIKNRVPVFFLYKLARHLRMGRFEVVHSFKDTPSIYGCIAAWLARIPVRVSGYRALYCSYGWIHRGMRVVDWCCTGWIVNSKAVRTSLSESRGVRLARIDVVYNGIDPSQFASPVSKRDARHALGISEDQLVVSMVGRLRPEKNHALFLESARCVLRAFPNARFLIVGDGDLLSELQRYARELGVSDTVSFLSGRDDIPEILRATDVYLLTSKTEGMANSLLEAMAAGIPVIATTHPGLEELMEDGREGFIAPQDDPNACAERVITLLKDADLRARMGAAGRDRLSRQFSVVAMVDASVKIYRRQLLATR